MTRVVKVGNLSIGGNNPIIIQSMTNTNSADVEATVKQINELEKAGCQLVRMTINNVKAAEAIKEIKKRVNLPLVADIHFDYRLALLAIENGIDKLRINPGNIGSDENVKKVVEAAKEKNIPIRIGVNSGSIEKEILEKYGKPCVEALVESALYHVRLLEKYNFFDIVNSFLSISGKEFNSIPIGERITTSYRILDFFPSFSERLNKRNNQSNISIDSDHLFFASDSSYLICGDEKMIEKAKIIYKLCGVKTRVLMPAEFMDITVV